MEGKCAMEVMILRASVKNSEWTVASDVCDYKIKVVWPEQR